ncbi:MAG: hypothetical protein IT307_06765 [Chloroflexi bacterium]|nr:hypothetical protein [Chloroflexota bacterium]
MGATWRFLVTLALLAWFAAMPGLFGRPAEAEESGAAPGETATPTATAALATVAADNTATPTATTTTTPEATLPAATESAPSAEAVSDGQAPTPTPTPTLTATATATDSGGEATSTVTTTPTGTRTPSSTPPAEGAPAPGAAGMTEWPLPEMLQPEYDIPNGHFFTQSVPDARKGYGLSIADAAGIPFWSEYRRLGGFQKLGYPLSRPFLWDGRPAQATQSGIMRWDASRRVMTVEKASEFGPLPSEIVEPEPPLRLGGKAASPAPWSGWWWPASYSMRGPHLFDADGPLARYDELVVKSGKEDPRTLQWEREELVLAGLSWAGHCNGWTAAALLEPEPTKPREVDGISFSVADQKGLLSEWHFADAALWWYGGDSGVSAADFHTRLIDWLGRGKRGFAVTFRPSRDDEVWSYPAYAFDLTMGPDAVQPGVTLVSVTLYLADNNVPADFVGVQPWHGEPIRLEYRITGPRDHPVGGAWTGASAPADGFARPAEIWFPDVEHRNYYRQLTSPNLDYSVIKRIVGR